MSILEDVRASLKNTSKAMLLGTNMVFFLVEDVRASLKNTGKAMLLGMNMD